jgi:uncharacterized membrane protein
MEASNPNDALFKRFWITLTLSMGFILIVLVPPFHSPDEFNHFYKAYHIADGHFTAEFDADSTHIGGSIPRSLKTISSFFEPIMHHRDRHSSMDSIFKYLNTPLKPNDKIFVSFPNTARYAPTAYTPQVLTFFILKQLNVPPLWMTYIGRLVTFMTWFVLILGALKWTPPLFRPVLMAMTLLPASVAIHATLNADIMTNGFLFIQIALFLHLKDADLHNTLTSQQRFYRVCLFAGLVFLTTVHKIIYFPMLGLLLLLKKENFVNNWFGKYGFIVLNLVLNAAFIMIWSRYVHHLIYPFDDVTRLTYCDLRPATDIEEDVNPDLQLQCIMSQPFTFLLRFIDANVASYGFTYKGYIATFGWELIRLPEILCIPFLVIMLIWVALKPIHFTKIEKFVMLGIAQSMTALFLLSMHLHWDQVGSEITCSYAAKYYYAMYALIILVLGGSLVQHQRFLESKWQFETLLKGGFVMIWLAFLIQIYARYYGIFNI